MDATNEIQAPSHRRDLGECRAPRKPAPSVRVDYNEYTLVYYVDSVRPTGLPSFTYIVSGSAAGRVRLHAYLCAPSPADAGMRLLDFFPDAYVESIENGRVEPVATPAHGVTVPPARRGFWSWLARVFH